MGQRSLDEEYGADRPEDGNREALEGPGQRDAQVAGHRFAELVSRNPGEVWAPYLFLDATYVKHGRDGRVQHTAVVATIGAPSTGRAACSASRPSTP